MELISAELKMSPRKMPRQLSKVTDDGISLPSLTVDVGLSDRLRIHSTGINAYITTKASTTTQNVARRARSAPTEITPGRGRAEHLDEDQRDNPHATEDQHADRRTQPHVETLEKVVVAQDRHRPGVVVARGQHVDVVEDPECVQRPEQQRHHDRRLDDRQHDPGEPPPRASPASSSSDMNGVVFQTSAITTMPSDGICSVSGALPCGSRLAR